jgi:hypothetical protein
MAKPASIEQQTIKSSTTLTLSTLILLFRKDVQSTEKKIASLRKACGAIWPFRCYYACTGILVVQGGLKGWPVYPECDGRAARKSFTRYFKP